MVLHFGSEMKAPKSMGRIKGELPLERSFQKAAEKGREALEKRWREREESSRKLPVIMPKECIVLTAALRNDLRDLQNGLQQVVKGLG